MPQTAPPTPKENLILIKDQFTQVHCKLQCVELSATRRSACSAHIINISLCSEKLSHVIGGKKVPTIPLVCSRALLCIIKFNCLKFLFFSSFYLMDASVSLFLTLDGECFKAFRPVYRLK